MLIRTADTAIAAVNDQILAFQPAVADHMHAIVAHQLDIMLGLDPGNVEHGILRPGQINIITAGSMDLALIPGLEIDRPLLPESNGICFRIPGQIAGFGRCQQLQVFQLAQLIIADDLVRRIDADTAVSGIERDIVCRDIGFVNCLYLSRFAVDNALLDSVQQLVLAPAIIIAGTHFCIRRDQILFVRVITGDGKIILLRLLIFAVSRGYGRVLFCRIADTVSLLHSLNISSLGSLQTSVVGISLSGVFVSLHFTCIAASQSLCPGIKSGQAFFLSLFCRFTVAVIGISTADKAVFQPPVDFSGAVRQAGAFFIIGINKAAVGYCQHRITVSAFDRAQTHIAVSLR